MIDHYYYGTRMKRNSGSSKLSTNQSQMTTESENRSSTGAFIELSSSKHRWWRSDIVSDETSHRTKMTKKLRYTCFAIVFGLSIGMCTSCFYGVPESPSPTIGLYTARDGSIEVIVQHCPGKSLISINIYRGLLKNSQSGGISRRGLIHLAKMVPADASVVGSAIIPLDDPESTGFLVESGSVPNSVPPDGLAIEIGVDYAIASFPDAPPPGYVSFQDLSGQHELLLEQYMTDYPGERLCEGYRQTNT